MNLSLLSTLFKAFAKFLFAQLPASFYERMMPFALLAREFNSLANAPSYKTRESLWREVTSAYDYRYSNVTFVEFGVFEGNSIKFFAAQNHNLESKFLGLDSFQGLPENWVLTPKGSFSAGGYIPTVLDDDRIFFLKGLFQETWDELYQILLTRNDECLVVHYDADLYSSTLFALTKIDLLNKSYIGIFDEFTGHEIRALYNYCQAYGAHFRFIGKVVPQPDKYPTQVACLIIPSKVSRQDYPSAYNAWS